MNTSGADGTLTVALRPERSDRQLVNGDVHYDREWLRAAPFTAVPARNVRLAHATARITLDPPWDAAYSHPDLLALALACLALPFTAHHLRLPIPCSRPFAEALYRISGVEPEPVDEGLAPRGQPPGGATAIAFSGGVDSVACLNLLTEREPILHHIRHHRHPDSTRETAFDGGAGEHAAERARELGYRVCVTHTDFQDLRWRPGFPTPLARCLPALLSADVHRVAFVVVGDILEEVSRVGYGEFVPPARAPRLTIPQGLLSAVGLVYLPIVAPLSEVVTVRLAATPDWEDHVASCVRGGVGRPCGNCAKCFRKALLRAAVLGDQAAERRASAMLDSRGVQQLFRQDRPHLSNVLIYCLERTPIDHPAITDFRAAFPPTGDRMGWLDRAFIEVLSTVPEAARVAARRLLGMATDPMSEDDLIAMRKWVTG